LVSREFLERPDGDDGDRRQRVFVQQLLEVAERHV
jgi:hypothetical protein